MVQGISNKTCRLIQRNTGYNYYSFFVAEQHVVLNGVAPKGKTFTVTQLLTYDPSEEILAELLRLARLYGTHDAI